mmetsp:Transcript_13206/g.17118  ORF Transcript_13206/g.17118 Transcript_13206/m.17118 type:complete len:266 (-) Transcript_13206:126-923(-)
MISPTINQHQDSRPLKLYSSWFCPYAQCVWIVLEEKKLDYQWVEINPYRVDQAREDTKISLTLDEKRELYPEFVSASPRGLIPALDNGGELVCDSKVIIEYLEEVFPNNRILPSTPIERARVRYWACFAHEKVVSNFYKLLIAPIEQRDIHQLALLDGLNTFAQNMDEIQDGQAFFCGSGFSLVDICLIPWMQRIFSVLPIYRGFVLTSTGPLTTPNFQRLMAWFDCCSVRPSIVQTTCDRDTLVQSYSGYANGNSTSDVAQKNH